MPEFEPLREEEPVQVGVYRLIGRLSPDVFVGAPNPAGADESPPPPPPPSVSPPSAADESMAPSVAGDVSAPPSSSAELVVVKLLHPEIDQERFLRLIEPFQEVSAFCTAQVLGSGLHDGRPYVVSEYIDGPTLERTTATGTRLRNTALHRLAVGTVTALVAIHQANVVHGDIRPGNVVLGPDGPRLINFGIGRAMAGTASATTRKVDVPAFTAPERLGGAAAEPPADLFSWAATLVSAASGRSPFEGGSMAGTVNRITNGEPDLPDLGDLRDLVVACLSKDPASRPTSSEVLLRLVGETNFLTARLPPPSGLPYNLPPPRLPPDSQPQPSSSLDSQPPSSQLSPDSPQSPWQPGSAGQAGEWPGSAGQAGEWPRSAGQAGEWPEPTGQAPEGRASAGQESAGQESAGQESAGRRRPAGLEPDGWASRGRASGGLGPDGLERQGVDGRGPDGVAAALPARRGRGTLIAVAAFVAGALVSGVGVYALTGQRLVAASGPTAPRSTSAGPVSPGPVSSGSVGTGPVRSGAASGAPTSVITAAPPITPSVTSAPVASVAPKADKDVKLADVDAILHENSADPVWLAAYLQVKSPYKAFARDRSGRFKEVGLAEEPRLSPTGDWVALNPWVKFQSSDMDQVRLTNLNTKESFTVNTVKKPAQTWSPAWSRDGRRLLLSVSNAKRTLITGFAVIDVQARTATVVEAQYKDASSLPFAFTPDGKIARGYSATKSQGIETYDMSGKVTHSMHWVGRPRDVSWYSPSGKQFMTVCPNNKEICIWDATTGDRTATVPGVEDDSYVLGWFNEDHILVQESAKKGRAHVEIMDFLGQVKRVLADVAPNKSARQFAPKAP
ncbi:protein kinase domain-containing protein [Nonomuraea sp. CA-143628]|uniref:protein kinase domain-containing protein n=1 Tax=Nonomuraea sp. CA-143628 TaxID=3239997 RepID=UPI003D8CC358